MHRTPSRRTPWRARSTGTLRIAARPARTLEDWPTALDCARTRRSTRTWWRCAVHRPRPGLRHDHPLHRRSRGSRSFRRLRRLRYRRGRYRWCRCNWRRYSSRRRRSWRCRDWRTRHHRVRRRRRRNRRTRRCGRCRRRCRHRRTSHDRSGRRLGCNRRRLRRRCAHNRWRLSRLRHHHAARRRLWLGCCCCWRGWYRRWSSGGRLLRRSRGLRLGGRWRHRRLRTRHRTLCLFLALLDRLQHVSGLLYPGPVDLRCRCFCAGRVATAISAAAALEMRAHPLRLIRFE